jgi:hypothetical protein
MGRQLAFVVRVSRDAAGAVVGVVERVRSGEKHRFSGSEALARLIEDLVTAEWSPEPPEVGLTP